MNRRSARRLTLGDAVAALVLVLSIFAGSESYAQSAASPSDAGTEQGKYLQRWLSTSAAVMIVSRGTVLDPLQPDAETVRFLKDGTDRLEREVGAMMRHLPPEGMAAFHIAVMPRLIEIVGAAREVLDAIAKKDDAATEASLDWTRDAVSQLRTTLARLQDGAAR